MSSLFDEFNFDFGEVENEAVKEEKKKPEKKPVKKSTKKAKKEEKVTLPVTVKMPYKTVEMQGPGEKTLEEVFSTLWAQGYKEVSCLDYLVEKDTIYLGLGSINKDTDEAIAVSAEHTIYVCAGELRSEFDSTHFDGETDVTVGDVADAFFKVNPSFAGCKWLYEPKCNVLFPYMDGVPGKNTQKTIYTSGMRSLSLFGNRIAIDAESEAEISKLPESIEGCSYLFGQVSDVLISIIKLSAKCMAVSLLDAWIVNEDARREKAQEKYILPFKIWLYNFNIQKEVTSADFGGKEKVTGNEVREYLKADISAFSDEERGFDFIYSKSQNMLSVGIHSGKKGGYNHAYDFEERDEAAQEANAGPFKVLRDSEEIRLAIEGEIGGFFQIGEKRVVNASAFRFLSNGMSDYFKLLTPPIPKGLIDAAVSYFRQDLSKEAIVNITYNRKLRRFFLRYPSEEETKAERAYIIYNFRRWFIRDEVVVLQIHSHNTMPAYFSSVDDRDEFLPGLYGVIGNLDLKHPTMKFRFCGMGLKRDLYSSDLFEQEVCTA